MNATVEAMDVFHGNDEEGTGRLRITLSVGEAKFEVWETIDLDFRPNSKSNGAVAEGKLPYQVGEKVVLNNENDVLVLAKK